MKSFTCDEARAHLSDFLAGEGGRPEANLLELHLRQCEACHARAEELVWQDRVIAELAGKARLEKMAGRVRAALESLDQMAVGEPERARPRRWISVAAAAVFLVASVVVAAILIGRSHDVTVATGNPTPKAPKRETPPEVKVPPEPETPKLPPGNPGPDPQPKAPEQTLPPEPPKPPPIAVNPNLPVETPKKQDPNAVPEPPKTPAVVREAMKPRPGDAIELVKPKTPDAAIDRGVAYLRTKSPKMDFSKPGHESRPEELVLWTYFMAGVPENDPEFQRLYKGIMERKLERTYDVALHAMFLEELDRVKYQWRIRQCAQFLVDNQCRNGQWSYGDPSLFVEELPTGTLPVMPAPGAGKQVREFPSSSSPLAKDKAKVKQFFTVVKRREGPPEGDNSNSMYAALGLRACVDAGIIFPKEVLAAAERVWREAIHDEGWCYGAKGHNHKPYASMTAGGVGSLVILDSIQGRDWKGDPQVKAGMGWLAKNFSVTEHRGPPEHGGSLGWMQYYYMYALERAGILYGAEKIGTHEWYKEGVEALLDAQRLDDGSWASKEGGNPVNDTCFAILFLRRATRGLPPVATK